LHSKKQQKKNTWILACAQKHACQYPVVVSILIIHFVMVTIAVVVKWVLLVSNRFSTYDSALVLEWRSSCHWQVVNG